MMGHCHELLARPYLVLFKCHKVFFDNFVSTQWSVTFSFIIIVSSLMKIDDV